MWCPRGSCPTLFPKIRDHTHRAYLGAISHIEASLPTKKRVGGMAPLSPLIGFVQRNTVTYHTYNKQKR